ncbi:MAG TPA: alpha/beta hydrolase-fold protein [Chitinophagaceae bacterium]|nr:alpha/beta hydrolase-fold protein [Chitinophagaceae bacterium]
MVAFFQRYGICILLLSFSLRSYSQYKITLVVKQPSVLHSADSMFVAGNFNSWDPGDKNFLLTKNNDGTASITFSLPQGNYEYKITRGSWYKVETAANGSGSQNRELPLSGDTTVNIEVKGWSDDFKTGTPARTHSASKNVSIIDTAFFMPQLKRYRRIWIYLPPDYKTSEKKYPVLYMHDGQNLFDNATAYAGEWGVDEFLDSIFTLHQKEVIVVGIDNGLAKRMNEYNPYSFQQFGKGEGDKYVDFLVKTLKPFIDKHYRTKGNKANTYIAGSSMGGLISLYAVLKYPGVFGGAGIFSPAFWTASGIDSAVMVKSIKVNSRLFFYCGGKENSTMVPDMERIRKEITSVSKSPVKEIIDADAQHNESAWRRHFPEFYDWTIIDSN